MSVPLFLSLDSVYLAHEIAEAERSVCYAAPGILKEPAEALAVVARRIGPEQITVCLDFDDHVMRMGFGTLDAAKTLRDAGIEVRSSSGLRTGLVIVDDSGYIYTPTALYLEAEERPAEAPNAMRLSKEQVKEALARLSPAAKGLAIAMAKTDEERQRIKEQAIEVSSTSVTDEKVVGVEKRLKEAPPAQFDLARQVRVFSAYLQYVEIKLSGVSIDRRSFAIPSSIKNAGAGEEFEQRLKMTFDVIEKDGPLSSSSKALKGALNQIKGNLTPSLGKGHGRVVLKKDKPQLEEQLAEWRKKLELFQAEVEVELEGQLHQSQMAIVDYFAPHIIANPPDDMRGQPFNSEDDAKAWLFDEIAPIFPTADELIRKMQLDVLYKDMTFDTLNQKGFLYAVKSAFPYFDWDKAYQEFRAAGEQT